MSKGEECMLVLARKLKDLNFSMLMDVYEEGNRENAQDFWPDLPEGPGMLRAEQEFYAYLQDVFFKTPQAVYALWQEDGSYISALRLEPYKDGWLLEALETKPDCRRQGRAEMLIRAVQETGEFQRIYSHVAKRNKPSLAVHEKLGFSRIGEVAAYIDGSFNDRACTVRWEQTK